MFNLRRPDAAAVYLRRSIAISTDKTSPKELVCRRTKCGIDIRAYAASTLANVDKLLSGQVVYRDPVRQPVAYAPAAPANIGVWSLGRARFLVEPRGACPPELSLGTRRYCFNQVIEWLQRHPEKQSVDVVAMESAWLPGSVIPHNNGQGWDIYNVARDGAGFTAKTKRHYGTQVRIPQGCLVQGVAQEAWLIGMSGRGKVAIEAEEYACAGGWDGGPIYGRYLDAQDFDGAPGDIRFTLAASGGSSPYAGGTDSRQGYGAGGYNPGGSYDAPPQPAAGYDYRAGTSAEIHGEPNTGGTPAKPKAKRKR